MQRLPHAFSAIKLHLGLSQADLRYRFKLVNLWSLASFVILLDAMFNRLQWLVKWPVWDTQKSMPIAFRKHCPKCTVIIDCLEVFIDRPSNLLVRALTYSSYKHHNTLKYLIGITPQGSVCFISRGWGSRASDKLVTGNSWLLWYCWFCWSVPSNY